MEIPAEKWYSAVKKRSSRRQYYNKVIEKRKWKALSELVKELNNEFPGVRIKLVKRDIEDVFTGIVGRYGKVSGAPAYIAFIGDKNCNHIEEKIGYTGEALILEITSLGLDSCWISGSFDDREVYSDIKLKNAEKLFAISPLGYAEEKPTISERILNAVISSKNRLPLETLVLNDYDENIPKWVKTGLESARLAPSAMNRQPWRFWIGNDAVTVQLKGKNVDPKKSKRLDCGIAMLHLEVGAAKEGKRGEWEYLEGQNVARFKLLN